MPALAPALRNSLEKTVIAARDLAEEAARVALQRLAVDERDAFASLSNEQRALRVTLRARAKQLGDVLDKAQLDHLEKVQPKLKAAKTMPALIAECAYEHWHRLLFARFLAENNLLMHREGVAVSLAECEELAAEEGLSDGWAVATRYAARMLPQVFRPDDPLLQVTFAPEVLQRLEKILDTLPSAVFTAVDSLGWVYQFWQSKRKDEVNASGEKIDATSISAVTQLFTEHYMVQFLLHNSLGAWWAARHPGEPLPLAPDDVAYLRRLDDGTPAAGVFPGWPERASELRILDPCGGSGHFIVAALDLMVRFRMREEDLSEREATDAVLRDNLYMLEIDQRCTQIAAFALALAAWKRGGYRQLPQLHVACSGIRIGATKEEWLALARGEGQRRLRWSLRQLYEAFQQAPELGSLVDPLVAMQAGWEATSFEEIQPLLEKALRDKTVQDDPDRAATGVVAQGLAKAAELLAGRYHLILTNVPFLGKGKQSEALKRFCDVYHSNAKADLATSFVERCRSFTAPGCSYAVVTPENWLFLASYQSIREAMLTEQCWNLLARLGEGSFASNSAAGAFTCLLIITNQSPSLNQLMRCINVADPRTVTEKDNCLRTIDIRSIEQSIHLNSPGSRISLQNSKRSSLLSKYAQSTEGLSTGDGPKYVRTFWELPEMTSEWEHLQGGAGSTQTYAGCEQVVRWQGGHGDLARDQQARIRGHSAWGKHGVVVCRMRKIRASLYLRGLFDKSCAVLAPRDVSHLSAIWQYCSSDEYERAIRALDTKLSVATATLAQVPFDLEHWQKVADEAGPIPEPFSNDPTQWLFKGHRVNSSAPLQVAVAHLLGYRWPEQGADELGELADEGGVVPLQAMSGELAAAERLRALLARAYGDTWSHAKEQELLVSVEFAGKSLDLWLRDGFFKQHCRLFHNRPFIWHIWDGRRDGFSALVNYHKLDKRLLEKLTYTCVGDWIARQQESVRRGEEGADARLIAVRQLQHKLKLILEGEPPYDIYVRWKKTHEQPIGWEPDLNDGVRLNIRPFMTAGVLRGEPHIKWGVDRGKNPDGSVRDNDVHLTRAAKEAARVLARVTM